MLFHTFWKCQELPRVGSEGTWATSFECHCRQELVSRMDHLTDGLRYGLEHMPSSDSPPIDVNSHLDDPFTSPSYPQEVPGIPSLMHSPSPGLADMDTIPDIPQTPANTQGTDLLPSCTKPSGMTSSLYLSLKVVLDFPVRRTLSFYGDATSSLARHVKSRQARYSICQSQANCTTDLEQIKGSPLLRLASYTSLTIMCTSILHLQGHLPKLESLGKHFQTSPQICLRGG